MGTGLGVRSLWPRMKVKGRRAMFMLKRCNLEGGSGLCKMDLGRSHAAMWSVVGTVLMTLLGVEP